MLYLTPKNSLTPNKKDHLWIRLDNPLENVTRKFNISQFVFGVKVLRFEFRHVKVCYLWNKDKENRVRRYIWSEAIETIYSYAEGSAIITKIIGWSLYLLEKHSSKDFMYCLIRSWLKPREPNSLISTREQQMNKFFLMALVMHLVYRQIWFEKKNAT